MDRLLIVIALLALVGIVLGIRLARRGRGMGAQGARPPRQAA